MPSEGRQRTHLKDSGEMNTFSVWAPAADTVQVMLGESRRPMERGDAGVVDAGRRRGGAGHRLRLRPRRRAAPPRPPLALPARGPARAVPGGGPRRLRLGRPGVDGAGAALRAAVDLRAARRDVHAPRARSTAAIEQLDHLVDLGVTHIELLPVCEFPGSAGLGLRRGRPVRPPPRLRRARRAQAPGRRLPRPRPRRHPRRRLQPPRAGRELPRRLRAVLHRPVRHPLGPGGELRRAGQRRGAALRPRQRHHVAARLPRRRPAPRRRPRHLRHSRPSTSSRSWPPTVRDLEAVPRASLLVIAESDLNDPRPHAGPPTPAATASTRLERRLPPRPPRRPDRRARRLLRGLRRAWPTWPTPCEQVYVYDGRYSAYRDRTPRPARHGLLRPPVPRLPPEPRPGRQPGPGRALLPPGQPRRLKIGAALVALLPLRAHALRRRGVGRIHPLPVLHRPHGPRARPGGQRRPAPRVRQLRLGPGRGARPPGPGHLRALPARLGGARKEPHAEMLAWHRQLLALRRRLPDLSDGDLDRVRTVFDEEEAWLVMNRGVAVAANFSGERRFTPLPREPGGGDPGLHQLHPRRPTTAGSTSPRSRWRSSVRWPSRGREEHRVQGLPSRGARLLGGPRGRQLQALLDGHKDVYDAACRGADGGAGRGAAPVRRRSRSSGPTGTCASPRQVPVQDAHRGGDRERRGIAVLRAARQPPGSSSRPATTCMAPDQVERYRTAVVDDRSGPEVEGLVADLEAAGYEVGAHETLKTAPRGFPRGSPPGHPVAPQGAHRRPDLPARPVAPHEGGPRPGR